MRQGEGPRRFRRRPGAHRTQGGVCNDPMRAVHGSQEIRSGGPGARSGTFSPGGGRRAVLGACGPRLDACGGVEADRRRQADARPARARRRPLSACREGWFDENDARARVGARPCRPVCSGQRGRQASAGRRVAQRDESDPRKPSDPPWRSRSAVRHIPQDVAAALLRGRRSRGWTAADASRAVGVDRRMIVRLESGERRPSAAVAELLIQGYRLGVADAARLRAVAAPMAGRSSPYRSGAVPVFPAGRAGSGAPLNSEAFARERQTPPQHPKYSEAYVQKLNQKGKRRVVDVRIAPA